MLVADGSSAGCRLMHKQESRYLKDLSLLTQAPRFSVFDLSQVVENIRENISMVGCATS